MIASHTYRRSHARSAPLVLVAVTTLSLLVGGLPASAEHHGHSDDHEQTADRHDNGRLPPSALRQVDGILLAPEAAAAYARMLAAAERDGVILAVTGGYRTYDRQVSLKEQKGWLAATPGTSMHGWGLAVDFDLRVTDLDWLHEHAATYGWILPAWAQPGGSKPEPWHWEYVGVEDAAATTPRASWEEGELVARARLEPADDRPGAWFDILEGIEDLDDDAGHYPGTAGPAEPGNFAVAGYQRDGAAPLLGVATLAPGDLIRVTTTDEEDLVYEVAERQELGLDDGWAVGPDPLDDGTEELMTLTSAADDGGIIVVWARRTTDETALRRPDVPRPAPAPGRFPLVPVR
jgi:hypothetical protein